MSDKTKRQTGRDEKSGVEGNILTVLLERARPTGHRASAPGAGGRVWRKLTGLRSSRFGVFCWRGKREESHQAGEQRKVNKRGDIRGEFSRGEESKERLCAARPDFLYRRFASRPLRSRRLANELGLKSEPQFTPGREDEREEDGGTTSGRRCCGVSLQICSGSAWSWRRSGRITRCVRRRRFELGANSDTEGWHTGAREEGDVGAGLLESLNAC